MDRPIAPGGLWCQSCLGTPYTGVFRRSIRMLPAQTLQQSTYGHPSMAAKNRQGCTPLETLSSWPAIADRRPGFGKESRPLRPCRGGSWVEDECVYNCFPETTGGSRRGTALTRYQYQRVMSESRDRTQCTCLYTTYAVRRYSRHDSLAITPTDPRSPYSYAA